MNELQAKIDKLINCGLINIRVNSPGRNKYRGSAIFPLPQSKQPSVGDFCRGVVVAKDEQKKELVLHLTYLIGENGHQYINHLQLKGCIRDYDLKQEYSIFTYVGNFRQTELGSEITAQVRSLAVKGQKKDYEMTLKAKKNQQKIAVGITRDQVEVFDRDWKVYKKYGCFSGSFLAQYEKGFANPGLPHNYSKDLRLKESQSLNEHNLVRHLQLLSLDYQRVRKVQEKQWSEQHFMEGLKYLKAEKPDTAMEHLALAKSFDKKNSKIYIARGCALANLNNLNEGLKQIREALRLSPENKEALQYQERIKKELRAKERRFDFEGGEEGTKKVKLANGSQLIKK